METLKVGDKVELIHEMSTVLRYFPVGTKGTLIGFNKLYGFDFESEEGYTLRDCGFDGPHFSRIDD